MAATKDSLLGALYCPNLMVWYFTTFMGEKGVFGRLLPFKTTMMEASLEGALIGSIIVLETIVETNKHSYGHFVWFSQSQSNVTTLAKTVLTLRVFNCPRPIRGGRRDLSGLLRVGYLYLVQW